MLIGISVVPQLVVRRVDRDREPELLRALAERDDAGQHADRGHGDVPRADAESAADRSGS